MKNEYSELKRDRLRLNRDTVELADVEQKRAEARRKSERDIYQYFTPSKHPRIKAKAAKSLEFFLKNYFPETFNLNFADFHKEIIETIQNSILKGTSFTLACPRSSGKSSICKGAIIWAHLYGYSPFSVLVATSNNRASALLEDIVKTLRFNDKLLEDFPETIIQFRMMEGSNRRLASLYYKGELLGASYKTGFLQFGKIEESSASESILTAAGIESGNLRGLSYTTSKGTLRPQLVLLDDPQDHESAKSESVTNERERIIKADIEGMRGAGKKFSLLCTCTVIEKGDLADRLLDRQRHPEFKGKIFKLLPSLPCSESMQFWEQYKDIYAADLRCDGDGENARNFYRENWDIMHKGAVVSWEDRKGEEDIDALESCMKLLLFGGEEAFFSEYQNAPLSRDDSILMFNTDKLNALCVGNLRGNIPQGRNDILTAFIDCHKNLLYYSILGFSKSFSGALLDYGTFPKQKRLDFELKRANPTIMSANPSAPFETAFSSALKELIDYIFTTPFINENGAPQFVDRLLIDANWGETTELVYNVIKESKSRAKIYPSHGVYFGAKSKTFASKAKKGDRIGEKWCLPKIKGRGVPYVWFDTNYWKTQLFNRIGSADNNNNLVFFGEPYEHYLLSKHLSAESPKQIECGGKRYDEWTLRDRAADNHYLDCMTGACVAASIEGAAVLDNTKNFKQQTSAAKRRAAFRASLNG